MLCNPRAGVEDRSSKLAALAPPLLCEIVTVPKIGLVTAVSFPHPEKYVGPERVTSLRKQPSPARSAYQRPSSSQTQK